MVCTLQCGWLCFVLLTRYIKHELQVYEYKLTEKEQKKAGSGLGAGGVRGFKLREKRKEREKKKPRVSSGWINQSS